MAKYLSPSLLKNTEEEQLIQDSYLNKITKLNRICSVLISTKSQIEFAVFQSFM